MTVFARSLWRWVGLCLVAVIVLGSIAPGVFQSLVGMKFACVNLVVAALIWAITCSPELITPACSPARQPRIRRAS